MADLKADQKVVDRLHDVSMRFAESRNKTFHCITPDCTHWWFLEPEEATSILFCNVIVYFACKEISFQSLRMNLCDLIVELKPETNCFSAIFFHRDVTIGFVRRVRQYTKVKLVSKCSSKGIYPFV